ncbi:MAG: hypothetical protein HYV97_20130 [Bdellovibrio sp.]|nr:hypothetical protein [Bdellovibrio sp.]
MNFDTNRFDNVDSELKPNVIHSDKGNTLIAEVPSIRLSPEQIEEIHVDEYTLTLFYATRMEALSLLEIKRQFPEPEAKKAHSIMDRFIKVGLIHITTEGKYYSNYPENYINYSHYRYDNDLEARKDAKVFQIMKEQTGKLEFWKNRTYFSMDAFYSDEQTEELLALFKTIKMKAKEFSNENAKQKNLKGLKFRRMKFYDMMFMFLFTILLGFSTISNKSYAGGNDPTGHKSMAPVSDFPFMKNGGGGNDPTMRGFLKGGGGHDPGEPGTKDGGGGHDPDSKYLACIFNIEGHRVIVSSMRLCQLQTLFEIIQVCEGPTQEDSLDCEELFTQLDELK